MRFEKFVEQHRVHLVISDAVRFALFIPHDQIATHLLYLFGPLTRTAELAKRQYVSAYELATIYAALGDKEQTFQLLTKAYEEHSFHLTNVNVCPEFGSLRSDPRFQFLVQRLGLSR